jgi:hypothetical protein
MGRSRDRPLGKHVPRRVRLGPDGTAGQRFELSPNLDGLQGERDDVLLFHLHPLCRDAPLSAVKVDLEPLRLPQLAGAHKDQRRQPERTLRHEEALVDVDCPEQLANALRLEDGRMVPGLRRRESAAKIAGRIALGTARGDGVPKHLPTVLQGAVCGLLRTATLDPAKNGQDFGRLDLRNGSRTQPREQVSLETAQDSVAVTSGPTGGELRMPLAGKSFETLGARERHFARPASLAGIDTGRELPS